MGTIGLNASQILIRQGQRKIRDPHLVTVFLLVEIWSHGRVRSEGLFLVQVQSRNIEQWHSPCAKSCGLINS